jgi:hypothetical protein
MLLLVFLLSVAVVTFYLLAIRQSNNNKVRFPGLPFFPLVTPWATYARFLWMGVPNAAGYFLQRYGDTVKVWIGGEETVITCRPDYAFHVLKSNIYRKRFGNETGLQHLGMRNSGIIWNNDVSKWKHLRGFFQRGKHLSERVRSKLDGCLCK